MKKTWMLFFWLGILGLHAQPVDLSCMWPAQWIRAAEGPVRDFGVFHFRHSFTLDQLPDSLVVHTSGDNRYRLYVNGQLATWGPARGDLEHWHYESTDLRPWLQEGENTLAAVVWSYGEQPPDAQLSVATGFLLCAGDKRFSALNTSRRWRAWHNPAISERPVDRSQIRGYYGAGAKENADGCRYSWGWSQPGFDDSGWAAAAEIEGAKAKTCIWAGRWKLVPRSLPMEQLRPEQPLKLRLAEGVSAPAGFPGQTDLRIPAHTQVRLVLDQGYETTAYPELTLSGGRDAEILVKYAEAPQIGPVGDRNKGNRGEIEGKEFYGYTDLFIADGGKERVFSPLWWRAYRYLEVTIETQEEPLVFHDFRGTSTGYPFEDQGELRLSGPDMPVSEAELAQIQAVGRRTLRLCAHETFMDCPYYEESQFPGDTRIEALVSYASFGDPRLGRNAIEQFSWSINSEGFLSARYPTNSTYYIPNYSLAWIGMLYDYLQWVGEPDYLATKLPVMRQVLAYFEGLERPDGSFRWPAYHNFVDWSLPRGEAPKDEAGYSALVDLHGMLAWQWAEALEQAVGDPLRAEAHAQRIERLRETIRQRYWQPETGLFADLPDGSRYSQHTNSLCVLTGVVEGAAARALMEKVLAGVEDMTQATLYWRFYVHEALGQARMGSRLLSELDIWQEALAAGVTTWPETGLRSRSECHAWGASPNYHLLTLVAGIRPAAPGFERVELRPQLAPGQRLQATLPHPKGRIHLDLRCEADGKLSGTAHLPDGLTGRLHWGETQKTWEGGAQRW